MEYQKRKRPRLKQYDYSLPGYYYVTIHTEKNTPHLSNVQTGGAFHRASVHLTELGKIAQQQLLLLEKRYAHVKMDKYVIMPTHIHAIIRLADGERERNGKPTLMDVVRVFKSLTTRECNVAVNTPGAKLFQTSFYETVLRNETAYQKAWQYIDQNPDHWFREPEDT